MKKPTKLIFTFSIFFFCTSFTTLKDVSTSENRLIFELNDNSLKQFKETFNYLNFDEIGKNFFTISSKVNLKYNLEKIKKLFENSALIKNVEYDERGECGDYNDTYLTNQWYFNSTEMEKVHFLTEGDSSINIGILDTGIDQTHDEFINKINTSLSKDFTSSNSYEDSDGHGTHVAGIMSANTNNSNGIASIAPNVKLSILKTDFYVSEIVSALNYAETSNIKIVNFSGWKFSNSTVLKNAIENYDGLFITIAGNNGLNIANDSQAYPARFNLDNMIVVGSFDNGNTLSSFSNYSSAYVDVLAPGNNIYSTYLNNSYKYKSGTSMAAPIVTATAALILSRDNSLTTSELKTKILDYADDSYFSNYSKYGKLDIFDSVHNIKHTYSYSYSTYTTTKHKAYCPCKEYSLLPHVVKSDAFSNGNTYATCLLCGGKVTVGLSINSISLASISESQMINDIIFISNEDYNNILYGNLTREEFYEKF